MFNAGRLELARKRRRLTSKGLAEHAGITPVTLSRIINSVQSPDEKTVSALADALGYPASFFYRPDIDPIDVEAASFRSLTKMTARERDAALSAGSIAYELADWIKARFNLPAPDLLDLGNERDPASAARALRQHWAIGERPIGNIIKLLETKGVRVFSLSENTASVDAFSCWRNEEPYVFLNTFKSTERTRFDAAHELAHLVLHKHGGPHQREAEAQAQTFASAFLMPEADVLATIPFVRNTAHVVVAKKRWGVSAVALAYRLHRLGRMTEWQYIQVNRSYRTTEPDGLPPERSFVWQSVLRDLWRDGIARIHIASQLHVPQAEIESLLFGLTGDGTPPQRTTGRTILRAVD